MSIDGDTSPYRDLQQLTTATFFPYDSQHHKRLLLHEMRFNLFIEFIFFLSLTPESVRWFLVKGKTEKAEQILYKVAKFNKKPIPQEPLQDCEKQRLGDLRDLFKTRAMTHKTLISWYCW